MKNGMNPDSTSISVSCSVCFCPVKGYPAESVHLFCHPSSELGHIFRIVGMVKIMQILVLIAADSRIRSAQKVYRQVRTLFRNSFKVQQYVLENYPCIYITEIKGHPVDMAPSQSFYHFIDDLFKRLDLLGKLLVIVLICLHRDIQDLVYSIHGYGYLLLRAWREGLSFLAQLFDVIYYIDGQVSDTLKAD